MTTPKQILYSGKNALHLQSRSIKRKRTEPAESYMDLLLCESEDKWVWHRIVVHLKGYDRDPSCFGASEASCPRLISGPAE